jgi:zinc protease
MSMSSRFLIGSLAMLAVTPALAQTPTQAPPALTQTLPTDSRVTIGTLPNGLRYYIRQNPKPEKRAELRLAVKAGSILEDNDQLGLAHFLEHTGFNGTTNFKKNELVSYLQSIGVRFGADLNASTGFDETVYMLPIPTDSAHIVNKAFQILEDWAHGQIFDPTEVANERGIVLEEWRGRKGAGDRMVQKWLPIALKGSRYATRLPIGTQESIQGATPEKLRRFYQDWYRPDQMAVIAVGDFDPKRMEALIKQHFSGIARRPNPRARPAAGVPDNTAPLVAIATDPEATSSSVNLTFKLPVEETKTVGDYRRDLAQRLYLSMLNNRFYEITQKPDAPFTSAGASKGRFFAGQKDAFTLYAGARDGALDKATEAILTEARRVDQFGFLESELSRAKQNLLRAYERAHAERNNTMSGAFVGEYLGNFLSGEAIPGIEYEYTLTQQLLPTIALNEVNALARSWITDENRVILVQAPEKPGVKVPSETELLALFDRAAKATVTAYTESVSEEPLIERLPPAGRVVSERAIASVGITEWRLSNGARVLLKPTDFKADEIQFSAYSVGGNSLVPNADYLSATMASTIVRLGGIGRFNQVDLGKKLTGKVVSVLPNIGLTGEGMTGNASPKDLETLLQLVHLNFTSPRLDSTAFAAYKNRITPALTNRGSDPNQVFFDTVNVTMAQNHFRSRPLSVSLLNEVKPDRALAIYKDRFADAGDFTFLFVGNVDPAVLKPLAERYLATLPAAGRKENWKDIGMSAPRGVVEKTVRKGSEPKAMTIMLFTGPFQYSPENRFALRVLTDLLQIKLIETLREQLGGTYSPDAGGGGSRIPRAEYSISIQYGSAPENVEKLAQTVLALVDSLKTKGPLPADVEKVREQLVRTREVDLKTNGFWTGNIAGRDQAGEDLGGLLAPYDEMIRKLTPALIQQAARQYLDTKNFAKFVLLPEAPKN